MADDELCFRAVAEETSVPESSTNRTPPSRELAGGVTRASNLGRRRRFELPVLRVALLPMPGLRRERGRRVRTPHDAARVLAPFLEHSPASCRLAAALLDARDCLLAVALLDGETASACCLRPSDVYRPAIVAGAVSLYLAHRHPSNALWGVRQDFQSAVGVWHMSPDVGVHVHDHLIFDTRGRYASLRASADVWSLWRTVREPRLALPPCPASGNERRHPEPRVGAQTLADAPRADAPSAPKVHSAVTRVTPRLRAPSRRDRPYRRGDGPHQPSMDKAS